MRNPKLRRTGFAFAVLLALTAAPAYADNEMPPEKTQGIVRYVSGGVGTEQQDAMKLAAPSYPLEVWFVVSGNADTPNQRLYTANINVRINDSSGKTMLDTRTEGPFLLAQLPDGVYTINAEGDGRSQSRQVRIDQGRHQKVVFEWSAG